MAKLIATRGAQYPLVSEFTFNFDDTMVDINGVLGTSRPWAPRLWMRSISPPVPS